MITNSEQAWGTHDPRVITGIVLDFLDRTAEAPDEDLATELADLEEVVDALMQVYGLTRESVLRMQQQRRAARGGFARRLRLLWTDTD
jgi:hypothetical protein